MHIFMLNERTDENKDNRDLNEAAQTEPVDYEGIAICQGNYLG